MHACVRVFAEEPRRVQEGRRLVGRKGKGTTDRLAAYNTPKSRLLL